MPTIDDPEKIVDDVIHLQVLREQLNQKEREYELALHEDKEFHVLKDLKTEIGELNRKLNFLTASLKAACPSN